jgi:hypothetical protein
MSQKIFAKLEKKLAYDLKPGELFITEDPEGFERGLEGSEPALILMLRTNLSQEEIEDGEMLVYRVHLVLVNREDPAPPKINPHAPPGTKEF